MPRPIKRVQEVAEDQWGLVTRRQLETARVAPMSLNRMLSSGVLERVERGVFRLRGTAEPDHLALRAAWLQLDSAKPAWQRLGEPDVALVSHASAASLYGVGDLRADVHEFTIPRRRQTRRPDVRLHKGSVEEADRLVLHGLPATRAGRMIADLLEDHVDPTAVAGIVAEVLRHVYDYPATVARHIAKYAPRFGLKAGDGAGVLDHLLRLAAVSPRERETLLTEAGSD